MTAIRPGIPARGVPPGTAAADFLAVDLAGLAAVAASATSAEVDRSLLAGRRSLADLAVLLSPAAGERLEDLAAAASRATVQRFGRVVRLFAPLYLSNECVSVCTYCGFSAGNEIARRTLSVDEVVAEGRELVARGFRHVLLVAGEHARIVSKDYLVECVEALAPVVPSLSVEVQVWDTATYRRLVAAGCEGLVVYQEAYDRDVYESCHLKGKKRNYDWRLAAPDRGAEAGMRCAGHRRAAGPGPRLAARGAGGGRPRVGIAPAVVAVRGVGVACPACARRPAIIRPARPLTDAEFVQVVCALRLCLPTVGISLSTRESPALRDGVVRLGVTSMSAGSHTEPGGYAEPSDAERQFEIADARSPTEVASMLRAAGYDPVWKDTIGARHVE